MLHLTTDPAFDFNRTEEYNLSIQICLDGFYFAVIQPKENRLIALKYSPVSIRSDHFLGRRWKEWVENNDLLKQRFAETTIICFTEKFTIVPGEFYNFEKQNNIASFVIGNQQGYKVSDNYLPSVRGNLIFSIPETLLAVINEKFPNHHLLHPLTNIIHKLQEMNTVEKKDMMLLFGKKHFLLLLFMNGELLVANSYPFKHPNDVLYYVFSVLEKSKISRNEVNLITAGEIMPENNVDLLLKSHFVNTTFLTPETGYNNKIFSEPLHRFCSLF